MLGRGEALSVQDAVDLLDRNISFSPQKIITGLESALDMAIADDIYSAEDLPGFDRSTVDGYAVHASDTFGATETSPSYIDLKHEVLMGSEPVFTLMKGNAASIPTGGMLPDGADAVVMLEHVQRADGSTIEVQKPVAPGDNVIRRDEDVKKGELLLSKGRRLKPYDIAVLASLGIAKINVYAKPLVSIISTGDEIVPPETKLKPGMIRDLNSYLLHSLVKTERCEPVRRGIIKDDHNAIKQAIESAIDESDAIIITGGSSVGAKDMAAKVTSELGMVLFHGVAMKPGKPMLAGMIKGKPLFGLPGHPRAVAVCFETFVRPVLRRLTGAVENQTIDSKTVKAKLTKSIHSSFNRVDNIAVMLESSGGELHAVPLLGKSGLIALMAKADGFIAIAHDKLGLESGEIVDVKLS